MADVQPPAPPPLPVDAAPKPPATAVIPNPPETVTRLPLSSILIASVSGPPANGQIPIATAHGNVLLQTPLPLPEDGILELQLQRLTPVLVLIKSINGSPLNQSLPQLLPSTGQPTAATLSSSTAAPFPGQPATNVVAGGIPAAGNRPLSGQPVAPVPPPANPVSITKPPPQLSVGTVLQATLLPPPADSGGSAGTRHTGVPASVIRSPSPAGTNPNGSGSGTQTVVSGYGLGSRSGTVGAPGVNNPSPAQPLSVRVLAVTLPENLVATPSQTVTSGATTVADQNSIRGTVVGQRTGGQPLVQVPNGLLSLETNMPLRSGTEILLQPITPQHTSTTPTPAIGGLSEMFGLRHWPALDEAISHVQDSQPTATQQFLSNSVPQPNTQLTTNILFFLTALRGGDLRQWLTGAPMRSLERERPDLLGRMNDDFGQLSRLFNDSPPSDWRTALVPFLNGAELEQIRMFSRGRRGTAGDGEEEDDQTRFVIDVELSQLGRVQLDGLVKGKEKRFDLFLRTDGPLPPEMRRDITAIFTLSAEATGVAGRLMFQGNADFVEVPLPADEETARPGVVV